MGVALPEIEQVDEVGSARAEVSKGGERQLQATLRLTAKRRAPRAQRVPALLATARHEDVSDARRVVGHDAERREQRVIHARVDLTAAATDGADLREAWAPGQRLFG